MSRMRDAQKMTMEQQQELIGDKLSFAGSEAYKLLRTNISMLVTADVACPIIGVTSSVPGEGKSTTAINLAYALVQDGKRVLLVEADLRMPTAAGRLGLAAEPGLTDLLVGMSTGNDVLQHSNLHRNLYVITSGKIPPNPSELLGSQRMSVALGAYAKSFDYIVVDLPPVTAVSDALVLSRNCTGLVLVVRRGFCRKRMLREALRQLDLVNARILGFVMTHSEVHSKNYKNKKYGYSYGYGYGYGEKKTSRSK